MLFVVTHEHAPELCPADDPTQVHKLTDENHIKESGVKVVGSYIASLEHTLYFVLEAEDYAQVVRYLRPIMKIGTPDVVPAQTLAKGLGPFFKG